MKIRHGRSAWWKRLAVLGITLVVSLTISELVLRQSGGYRFFATRLEPARGGGSSVERLLASGADVVREVLGAAHELQPDLDPAWLTSSPPRLTQRPVPTELQSGWADPTNRILLCQVNEAFLRELWTPGSGLGPPFGAETPREFHVFQAPDASPYPRYRFWPAATMPDGLTTNALGYRGPDLEVDKPPRTLRIACVGASTTISAHNYEWSYPELIQNWLGLWSEARGLELAFEVVNAGREGIRSTDIRAIVEQEIVPLAVDYVVYYEGANQFGPAQIGRHVEVEGDVTLGRPPPGTLPAGARVRPADERGWLWDRSATARAVRSLAQGRRELSEPSKPAQSLSLPSGLDERDPDPTRAAEALDMGVVLDDLDGILAATRGAEAGLVLCSFAWLVHDGLSLSSKQGSIVFGQLNGTLWPYTYAVVRRLVDLQNSFYESWARANGVDFLDVAARLPQAPDLFTDTVHNSRLGVRLRAWLVFAGLVRILERDLAAGLVPVPDREPESAHPALEGVRRLTAQELDAG